jgi:S-adenosylmethionine:tRNA ribosyltransferase-isomerase
MHPKDLSISDYDYQLPDQKIAQYPVEQRDKSKLLISNQGKISESTFERIGDYLPQDSLMVFNDTKVIRARLQFRKSTGARIEIFILEPISPTAEVQNAFQVSGQCEWKCLIGGAKKWKDQALELAVEYQGKHFVLKAEKHEAIGNSFRVSFSWQPSELTFSDVLIATGSIPLPPYMNRQSESADIERYQTVYAKHQGSVAAPTAGLHFTDEVMENLKEQKRKMTYVSLHVGAGTFKPVSTEKMHEHEMHTEQVVISLSLIEELLAYQGKKIIAVGTTTTRSLESLYWFGCQLIQNQNASFKINQWEPYQNGGSTVSTQQALETIRNYMTDHQLDEIHGETQIIIAPGYDFKIVDVLITNFHQPKSTLLLLVSAFYGADWRHSYRYALDHEFRFLSYGDSCLFFKKEA